jgi:hypothetical protein
MEEPSEQLDAAERPGAKRPAAANAVGDCGGEPSAKRVNAAATAAVEEQEEEEGDDEAADEMIPTQVLEADPQDGAGPHQRPGDQADSDAKTTLRLVKELRRALRRRLLSWLGEMAGSLAVDAGNESPRVQRLVQHIHAVNHQTRRLEAQPAIQRALLARAERGGAAASQPHHDGSAAAAQQQHPHHHGSTARVERGGAAAEGGSADGQEDGDAEEVAAPSDVDSEDDEEQEEEEAAAAEEAASAAGQARQQITLDAPFQLLALHRWAGALC